MKSQTNTNNQQAKPRTLSSLPGDVLVQTVSFLDSFSVFMLSQASNKELNKKLENNEKTIWGNLLKLNFPDYDALLSEEYGYGRFNKAKFKQAYKQTDHMLLTRTRELLPLIRENNPEKLQKEAKLEFNELFYRDSKGSALFTWAKKNRYQSLLDYFYLLAQRQEQFSLEEHKDQIHIRHKKLDVNSLSLICLAACFNQVEAVSKWAKDRKNDSEITNVGSLMKALNISAEMNDEDLLYIATKNPASYTLVALLLAVKSGYVDVALNLMSTFNIASLADKNALLLYMYARNGNRKNVDRLLQENKEINVNTNCVGEPPLHVAIREGHVGVVDQLLDAKADVHACGDNGKTTLHEASWAGDEKMTIRLLAANAKVNAKTLDSKWTPLHNAVAQGHYKVVARLLEVKGIDVNVRTNNDETALYLATTLLIHSNGNSLLVERSQRVIEHLLEREEIDVNARTSGKTMLQEVIQVLPCFDRWGKRQVTEVIQLLLAKKEIDVNARLHGLTPLHFAARCGCDSAVDLLLRHERIDVNARTDDEDEKTAVDIAKDQHSDRLIDMLHDSKYGKIRKLKRELNRFISTIEEQKKHSFFSHSEKEKSDMLEAANVLEEAFRANYGEKSISKLLKYYHALNDGKLRSICQRYLSAIKVNYDSDDDYSDDNHNNINIYDSDDEASCLIM